MRVVELGQDVLYIWALVKHRKHSCASHVGHNNEKTLTPAGSVLAVGFLCVLFCTALLAVKNLAQTAIKDGGATCRCHMQS
jgi:hypothetical protein